MDGTTIRQFVDADRADVIRIWHACDLVRPWNDPDLDIDRKVAIADAMFLVAERESRVVGAVMAGYDGHRGQINYLAVDPAHRGHQIGADLMGEAERRLAGIGCVKVNLQVRRSNEYAVGFYVGIGYDEDDVVSMGKRLSDDDDQRSGAGR